MARIEFKDVDQKMEDLRGYYKCSINPDDNPYKTSELNDDEFNFLSGMNYVASSVLENWLANMEYEGKVEFENNDGDEYTCDAETMKAAIESIADWIWTELEEHITGLIENHEPETDE